MVQSFQRCFAAFYGLGVLLASSPVSAPEPLWGETPTVFGFGILHGQVRYGLRDAGGTSGGGVKARSFEQE